LLGIKTAHLLTGARSPGDICDVFLAESGDFGNEFVKIARIPDDNDLMRAEQTAIRKFDSSLGELWRGYFPSLVDYSVLSDGQRECEVNIFAQLEGYCSLEQIYMGSPSDVPHHNALWIWRRMLTTLFLAHDQGIIHGAVLPCHVMVNPKQIDGEFNRVVLVDWCYSRPWDPRSEHSRVKAIVRRFRGLYAPEILENLPASPATDIYMAARTFIYLLGGKLPSDMPSEIAEYFLRCLYTQDQRAQNDIQLQQELDKILSRLGLPYYDSATKKRIFRPFPYQPQPEGN
jgi:hypothetical protein